MCDHSLHHADSRPADAGRTKTPDLFHYAPLVSLCVFGKPALLRRAVEAFNFIKMTSANVTDTETRMNGSN